MGVPVGAGTLLSFLRQDLSLLGAKPGCGEGECGACTVLVDGEPTLSCQVDLADVAGRDVTTIEGLDTATRHKVERSLDRAGAAQCGYCSPAMVIRATAVLSRDQPVTEDELRRQMAPNLC